MSEENNSINEEIKKLVLARIEIMPPNYKLSVGDMGTFSKQDLIESVKRGDKLGNQVIQMQMNFIRALSSGKFSEILSQEENEPNTFNN